MKGCCEKCWSGRLTIQGMEYCNNINCFCHNPDGYKFKLKKCASRKCNNKTIYFLCDKCQSDAESYDAGI